MTALIGYPDYFKPRDYIAGLIEDQVIASQNIQLAPVLLFTVPAGRTLYLTHWSWSMGIIGAPAGNPRLSAGLELNKGFDGNSPLEIISRLVLVVPPNGYDNESLEVQGPVAVQGGPAGNNIDLTGGGAAGDVVDGWLTIYGVLTP